MLPTNEETLLPQFVLDLLFCGHMDLFWYFLQHHAPPSSKGEQESGAHQSLVKCSPQRGQQQCDLVSHHVPPSSYEEQELDARQALVKCCPQRGQERNVGPRPDYDRDPDKRPLAVKNVLGEEISEIARSETYDQIDEAWEEGTDDQELCLHHLSLGRHAIQLLIQKADQLRADQAASGTVFKRVKRVELFGCSFSDSESAVYFCFFLHCLGSQLEELFIVDTFTRNDPFSLDERAVSCLRSLHRVVALKRLAIDTADLSGYQVGLLLQHFLTQTSPNLKALRLNDCRILSKGNYRTSSGGLDRTMLHASDCMLEPFCAGLQSCHLTHLDLDGWYLSDRQLTVVVNALIQSPCTVTLESLDLSRNDMTFRSFKTLTKLLKALRGLRELILLDCPYLATNLDLKKTRPAVVRSFARACGQQLQELYISSGCGQAVDPLVATVLIQAAAPHLESLHMGQDGEEEEQNKCQAGALVLYRQKQEMAQEQHPTGKEGGVAALDYVLKVLALDTT